MAEEKERGRKSILETHTHRLSLFLLNTTHIHTTCDATVHIQVHTQHEQQMLLILKASLYIFALRTLVMQIITDKLHVICSDLLK